MSLRVTSIQKVLGLYIVSSVGSLDSNTYRIFEEEVNSILEKSPTMIVFDMECLEYLSSSGIRIILKARKELKENDGKVVFMKLQTQVKKVFEIINAIPSMKILSSIEELDEYLYTMQ